MVRIIYNVYELVGAWNSHIFRPVVFRDRGRWGGEGRSVEGETITVAIRKVIDGDRVIVYYSVPLQNMIITSANRQAISRKTDEIRFDPPSTLETRFSLFFKFPNTVSSIALKIYCYFIVLYKSSLSSVNNLCKISRR